VKLILENLPTPRHPVVANTLISIIITSIDNSSTLSIADAIKVIIDQGGDVNSKNEDGRTALMEASRIGKVKMVELLLKKGASSRLNDKHGYTSLMLASECGQYDVIEHLLGHTSDSKALITKNKSGWSALMLASWNCHSQCVKLLLKNGARVDAGFLEMWLSSIRRTAVRNIIKTQLGT
jgi:ankyrin repeat protein